MTEFQALLMGDDRQPILTEAVAQKLEMPAPAAMTKRKNKNTWVIVVAIIFLVIVLDQVMTGMSRETRQAEQTINATAPTVSETMVQQAEANRQAEMEAKQKLEAEAAQRAEVERQAETAQQAATEAEVNQMREMAKRAEAERLAEAEVARQAAEAKQKLEAEAVQQEQNAWKNANRDASEKSYQNYLVVYPRGLYAAEALASIGRIRKALKTLTNGLIMVSIPGKNYEIGKYEISVAEWRAVMELAPNRPSSNCEGDCPVENVSWDAVQLFIKKLNTLTNKQYRLLTETEWEYACHGGKPSQFCGGYDLDSLAWTRGNSNMNPHPVGMKRSNGYGLYDMTGNVREWTDECFQGDCSKRVARGGSYFSHDSLFSNDKPHASSRDGFESPGAYYGVGFRLARTLP